MAKTRLKYSENMGKLKKMHYNHKSIHRGSIQLESMTNDVMNQDWGSHKEDGKPGFKAAVDAVVAVKGLARKTSISRSPSFGASKPTDSSAAAVIASIAAAAGSAKVAAEAPAQEAPGPTNETAVSTPFRLEDI